MPRNMLVDKLVSTKTTKPLVITVLATLDRAVTTILGIEAIIG
jgi:hypothetical protein